MGATVQSARLVTLNSFKVHQSAWTHRGRMVWALCHCCASFVVSCSKVVQLGQTLVNELLQDAAPWIFRMIARGSAVPRLHVVTKKKQHPSVDRKAVHQL